MKAIIAWLKDFFSYISLDCLMVCLYLVCLPFTIVTTPAGSLLKLITYPVTAVLGIKLLIGDVKPFKFNSVHLIYSLYILFSFSGLLMLREEVTLIVTKDMLLTYVVFMLVSIRMYNNHEQELIDTVWIVVGLVCTYLILTSNEMINEFENRTIIRIFGFTEDPNQFCAYYIMPVMVALKRIAQHRKLTPFYLVLLVLILYGVLKTGSRGGLIGIIIGILFFVLFGTKNLKAKLVFVASVAIIGSLVTTVLFPLLPSDIQERFSVESVEESGGSGRTEIWEYLLDYTTENPARIIRGSGVMSTYPIMEMNKHKGGAFSAGRVAHNQFVQVFVDQGVIGLFLFLLLFIVCVVRNYKNNTYDAASIISVMAFSLSLSMYVFKPYINILMMCAMTFSLDEKEILMNTSLEEKNDYKIN